jgi:hypothetical protein
VNALAGWAAFSGISAALLALRWRLAPPRGEVTSPEPEPDPLLTFDPWADEPGADDLGPFTTRSPIR